MTLLILVLYLTAGFICAVVMERYFAWDPYREAHETPHIAVALCWPFFVVVGVVCLLATGFNRAVVYVSSLGREVPK